MRRRDFLGAVAAASTVAVAGCSQGRDGAGGPHGEAEKSINVENGTTYVDLKLVSWFSCSWASLDTEKEYPVDIEIVAAGETLVEDVWQVRYDDCMVEETTTRSYELDGEYDSVLVNVASRDE